MRASSRSNCVYHFAIVVLPCYKVHNRNRYYAAVPAIDVWRDPYGVWPGGQPWPYFTTACQHTSSTWLQAGLALATGSATESLFSTGLFSDQGMWSSLRWSWDCTCC